MERKKQIFIKNFKMPHLFREDLENIEKIIKIELNPDDYKLESKLYTYQKIEEISNDTDSVNQFRIRTFSPSISVDFTREGASIYTSDDDIKTIGAINKIIDIISKRERNFLWYSSKFGQLLAFAIFTQSVLSLFSLSLFHLAWKYAATIAILSAIWVVTIFLTEEYRFSVIEFIYRKNRSNFFLRNRDQIGLNIIIAILSFLVGWFLKK